LRFQRFLTALVWCWAASLACVAIGLGVSKLTGKPIAVSTATLFGVAVGIGTLGAALIAALTGPTRSEAALAIDRVFHLCERLSTLWSLDAESRESPAGRALINDALRQVRDLEVTAEFSPRLPRRAWVPLIPAVAALALGFAPELKKAALARSTDPVTKKVIEAQSKLLGKKISSQRQELQKEKLDEADKLLAAIEKASERLAQAPPARKDAALMELNTLSDQIKERQKQLGSPEQIDRQLRQLQGVANNGPADQLAKDLARADFQKAAQDLKQLQEKLASGKMSEAEKKALQNQLREMSQQLQKLANLDQRRKQLQEARKQGGLTQKQFEQEMAKLDQQAKGLEQLKQLAGSLAKAEQQLQQGDMQKAASALGKSEQELTEMARQLQELEALDGALADLQDAKNGMVGNEANQLGEGLGGLGGGLDSMRKGNGFGLGRGRGQGDRPEAPDNTAAYTTQVKQQFGKGKAVLQGFAPPRQPVKGQSVIDVQGNLETDAGLAAEALSNQRVPKHVEKHVRGYFDQLNKGR
jgi:hypothetical protein